MAAPIAALVVRVLADVSEMKESVASISGTMDKLTGMAGKVGTALAGAFAVTAIVQAGQRVLDFAGEVSDLAARLRLTTDTVQEWQATFGKASIPIESVAKASEQLSLRINGGDKSAVGALKAMGLSVDALVKMKPEDRFIEVADAVGQLQNQDDRIAASKGLFGRGGPELLAALDGHLGETIDQIREMGLVIDGETIAAADDFGDQLGLMGTQLLGIVATVVGPLLPALSELGNLLSWLGREVIGPVLNVAIKSAMWLIYELYSRISDALGTLAEFGAKLPGIGKYVQQYADLQHQFAAKAKDLQANLWKQKDATEATGTAAQLAAPKLAGLGDASDEAAAKHKKQADELARLVDTINMAAASDLGFGLLNGGYDPAKGDLPGIATLRAYADAIAQMRAAGPSGGLGGILGIDAPTIERAIAGGGALGIETIGQHLEPTVYDATRGGFAAAVGALPDILQRAFTGGGGLRGAVDAFTSLLGSSFGSKLFAAGGPLNGIGNKLTGLFGDAFGLALPGIGSALGALVGPFIGKMAAGLRRLFGGPSEAELAGRDLVNTFSEGIVNALSTAQYTEAAGVDGLVDESERWRGVLIGIRDAYVQVGRAPQEAEAALQRLWDAERRGPSAVRQVLDEIQAIMAQARQASSDATTSAIEDETTAIQDALQALVDQRNDLLQSVANEAPEEVMGVIESQIRGQVAALDAQIAAQHAAMVAEAARTADAVEDKLSDIQPEAIHLPVVLDMPDLPSIRDVGQDLPIIPMADGGAGRVTGPTLFYSAGNEDFAFSGEGKRFASGGGSVSVNVVINNPSYDTPAGRARSVDQMSRALMDALRRQSRLVTA